MPVMDWGQVCIASSGKVKKYCMEVDFGENADSADVFGRVLGFRGTPEEGWIMRRCPQMGEGKIFGSSEFVTASAVWLWICSPNDILLLND